MHTVKTVIANIAGYFSHGVETRKKYIRELQEKIRELAVNVKTTLRKAANLLSEHFDLANKKHDRNDKTFHSLLHSVQIEL